MGIDIINSLTYAELAQLEELLVYTEGVGSSSLSFRTIGRADLKERRRLLVSLDKKPLSRERSLAVDWSRQCQRISLDHNKVVPFI